MCTGNICRSPTAEAIFRKKVAEAKLDDVIFSDSAATSGHHVGETPDVRAQLACRKPDPYYGLNEGFNQVLDYCTDACGGLLETLERKARMMQKSLQATKAAG